MNKILATLSFSLLAGGLLLAACLWPLPDGRLHIFVLDIGQGDSILVRTPANEFVLIDGGPDESVLGQLGRVMPFYERTIDVVILTHPHADHVNGLVEVLKRYHVREVMMTGVKYSAPGYTAFLEQINKQQIPVVFAGSAMNLFAGDQALVHGLQASAQAPDYQLGGLVLDMLYPFASLQGRSFENLNNSSIVFRLLYGQRRFYFAGDLEMEEEAKLVSSHLDLRADFLKAGHHGSRTSSTEALLDRIKPLYAAISCGVNNVFKHPHAATLQHLHERQIRTYRTDVGGMVEAESDGENLRVWSWGK